MQPMCKDRVHKNVQQFTEICLDCGWNTYTTDAEYIQKMEEEKARRAKEESKTTQRIKELEHELFGVKS